MTPNNHDDLSSDLGRALHERAGGLVGAPITLSDVKGRASRIRRRRAIAATAATAAVVAIIVPTAIAGTDLFDSTSNGGQIATQDPTPNPTETTGDAQSWPQRLDTAGLPLGEAPQVVWFEGTTMHTPDGDIELPHAYAQVAPYDDGYLALDYSEGTVVRLDASGQELGSSRSQGPIAVSSDGDELLYVTDGVLTIHDNTTGEDTEIGGGHETTEPVAVEDGVAYYNVDTGSFPQDGRRWAGGEVDPIPGAPVPYLGLSSDGTTIEHSSITDSGSCSTLRSSAGDALGDTCDFTLDEFSPNGDFLLAGPAYRDGFGDGEVAVLPADGAAVEDGRVVFHYHRTGDADPFFLSSTWEDDSHILAVTFTPNPGSAKGTWQILRIGLDGSVENAVDPVEANDLNAPFSLS